MSLQRRAIRLTRIATALALVSDEDLNLVAEVAEDLALQNARLPGGPPASTASILREVTGPDRATEEAALVIGRALPLRPHWKATVSRG